MSPAIRRLVDPEAELLYVPVEEVACVAEREGAIPYDVTRRLGPGAAGRIVHGADVAADIGIVPGAAGLKAIAHGFALVHGDADHEKIGLEKQAAGSA